MTRALKSLGLIIAASLFAPAAMGASLSVFGNNGDALECYNAAKYVRVTYKARKACDDALSDPILSNRDRAAVYVNRGILRRAAEDIQGAFDDYKAALKILPDLPEAHANRGNIYYLAGYFDKALADYEFALERNIDDARAVHLNRALVLAEMGEIDAARRGLMGVAGRYPDWIVAQEKLRKFQARHG